MKIIKVKFSGSVNFNLEDTLFERFSDDDINLIAKNLLRNVDVKNYINDCEVENADQNK